MILSLPALSAIRVRAGLTKHNIVDITAAANRPISMVRLRELENGPIRSEPWLDEAIDLARILLLPGIVPMMWDRDQSLSRFEAKTLGDLTLFDLGREQPDEVDLLKRGVRLPLSMACRLAARFGLPDPIYLEQLPVHQQIWSVVEAGERTGGPLMCPWCLGTPVAGAGTPIEHLPTCLPANVWGGRSTAPYATAGMPKPLRPGSKGSARLAWGLASRRKAKGITQGQLASDVGLHPGYISRIEQARHPLTEAHATNMARLLGCSVEDLFARPAD